MRKESKKGEIGQVLLIVILVIIVSLTIGLSIASRSITSLRTSTEEAESQKALAAAEAGIEKTLQDLTASSGTFLPSDSSYETTVVSSNPDLDPFLLNGGSEVTQGEGADIWLAEHNSDETINYGNRKSPQFFHLHWGVGSETDCDSADPSKWPAALEVIVVSGTSATDVKTTRYAYDYCASRDNKFISAQPDSKNIGGKDFLIRTPQGGVNKDLADVNDILFMRVIPIYKSTMVGVYTCNPGGQYCTDLPSQGHQITSTGTAGETSRKISVFKGFSQAFLPYISYGLFVPAN